MADNPSQPRNAEE
jgi:hypothetical protein